MQFRIDYSRAMFGITLKRLGAEGHFDVSIFYHPPTLKMLLNNCITFKLVYEIIR